MYILSLSLPISPSPSFSLSLSVCAVQFSLCVFQSILYLPLSTLCSDQMALHGYTAYSASKYAVRGLAEVLDMELEVHNVRVSVSFPPDTDTPMLRVKMYSIYCT